MDKTKAQIICAPSRPPFEGDQVIFLAGTTTAPDWREPLITSLSHAPITIINPLRQDWDSSWIEDEAMGPFREQVQWELDMQEKADLMVIYFGPNTDAPVSLLELGLCARSGKALVVCDPGYRKRGNVQIICGRYGVQLVNGLDSLPGAVLQYLATAKEQ